VATRTRDTYVIANNHFEGKAVVNALELRAMIEGTPVDVPPDLVRRYERLAAIQRPSRSEPEQRLLF